MQDLVRDFVDQGMQLRETHISWVFLSDDKVYKLKKPVNLGFLDFRTLSERKRLCEAEVTLNRRLAPDVYLGVVPITRDAHGTHRLAGAGEPVEWAVQMRRLPDHECVEQRLADGRLQHADVLRLAQHLARFHSSARHDADTALYGSAAAIEANVRENFEQTRPRVLTDAALSPEQHAAIERWQLAFLHEQRERFAQRSQQGRVRDGHGDLRLEHCYLDDAGAVRIIDCIEFNDRFRYADVCADLAFLAMDLQWHDRHDFSEALLAAYACETGDYDLYGVVDFYESYRAFVRGKVSAMLAGDAGAAPEARQRAQVQAHKYYCLAEACTRDPLQQPVVYAVGGVIASGKSTLADALGALVHAPVIDSDRTRKALAGVDAYTPLPDAAFAGHYGPQASAAVYEELLRRAGVVLDSKRSVVLDASFRSRSERAAARELAHKLGVPFLFIECHVDPELCRQRLVERARGRAVSDGRLEILDAFVDSVEPVDELPNAEHLRIDTGRALQDNLAVIAARLRAGG